VRIDERATKRKNRKRLENFCTLREIKKLSGWSEVEMKVFDFWRFLIVMNFWGYSCEDYRRFGFDIDLSISPKCCDICPHVWDLKIEVHIWRWECRFFIAWKKAKK
jgi:hypothetical protein